MTAINAPMAITRPNMPKIYVTGCTYHLSTSTSIQTLFIFPFFVVLFSLFTFSFVLPLFAQTSPPRLINLQAVLVDEGGNVLYNQQEADIIFSIVDGAGETFYEEEQHVVLVNGAISVLVGQGIDLSTGGATGGIPLGALEPNGTKLLRVKLKDQSIPQEDLELATVPYAMYADKAYSLVEPLDSSGILDGTIAQADLNPELIAYIDERAGGASEDQLAQHRQEDGAHPASSISVVNTFINAAGNNVQQILIGLDRAIGTRRNQEGVLGEEIDTEASDRTAADAAETAAREAAVSAEAATRAAAVATEAASRAAADASESATREAADTAETASREAADTAESTTRATEDTRVLESEISRAGDSIYGDLVFYTDDTLSTRTMSIAPSSGDISSQGELSLLDGLVSINRDASTSDPVISIDDTDGVERLRLDGDTGLMTLDGSVTITGTVDGVDVSSEQATRMATDDILRGDLNAHTGAFSGVHGVTGNIVGTIDSQTLSNKTLSSPSISDFTNAVHNHQSGTGGGTLDASAITLGELSDARISNAITVGASGSVDDSALSTNITKLGSSIQSSELASSSTDDDARAVTTNHIRNNAIDTSKIANNTIQIEDIIQDENNDQSLDKRYVNENGDTMSGDLVVPDGFGGNIQLGLNVVNSISRINSLYVDKVSKGGDTMTGSISFDDTQCPDSNGDGVAGPCLVDGVNVSTDLVRKSGDTMTGPLTFRSSDNTMKLNIADENGSILMKGDLSMEGGNINMSGGNIIMGAGSTVDGVNISQMAMRIRRTGQVVMPLTNAASIETRTVTAPSDDYVACGAWGVLDAFRVTGGGGDFDNDDLWGFQGTGDTGSAVTWQLIGTNAPGSTKSVQISFHSQGDDAVYAGRGFVLFARGISCAF